MTKALRWLLVALAAAMGAPAFAHVTATGLAELRADGETVTYRLTVILAELPPEAAATLRDAAAGDREAAQRVADSLNEDVHFTIGGEACQPGRVLIQGGDEGAPKAVLTYTARCPSPPGRLSIAEDWSSLFGEHYRTILSVTKGSRRDEFVLGEQSRAATVDFGAASAPGGLWSFVRLGISHILTGYDHILFLLALLVGAANVWRVLGIVTAFTLAHSITLSLAATGLVHAPSAVVEPLIAATIVWVAVENILTNPSLWHRFAVAFAFGLVHGLGFADALQELDLSGWSLVRALFGFNIGVEIGQAMVVLIAIPVLFYISSLRHARLAYRVMSLGVAGAGAVWFVQRVFLT